MVKWLLFSLIWLIGRIPFRLRSKIGTTLGLIASVFPSRDQRIALLQIKKFLKPRYPTTILRNTYAHFGATFFECLNLTPLIKAPEKFITFPSWPEAQHLLAQKRGIVALSAHLGNWDAMGAFFANQNVSLMAVAKQARNSNIQFVLERLRSSFGFTTLWRANKKGIADIREALEAGSVVAALIDQDTRVANLFVPFFGTPVPTPSSLIEIGKKSNSLITSAFVVKTNSGKFEIRIEEISSTLSTQEILNEYNRRLEKIIREFPSQWAWIHKRWRTLNNGERLGGKKYLQFLKNNLTE